MDIGTDKAGPAERARVPHHGLDLVAPDEPFTAAAYQRHATAALTEIAARGGIACLVGGTGLYLRAVARGLPLEDGSTDHALRCALEDRLATDGLDALVDELWSVAPDAAERIDLHNPRRVVRALERLATTGSALPAPPRGYPGPSRWLETTRPREEHRRRVRDRAAGQFAGGLIDEAAALRERYGPALAAYDAFGYHEAFGVLDGDLDLEDAVERDATRTWAYARRQLTWFRGEPDVTPIEGGPGAMEAALTALGPLLGAADDAEYAGTA